ncbi:P-loop containing nucleoside triphosphate hydrolase protein [Sparassis latifolia]
MPTVFHREVAHKVSDLESQQTVSSIAENRAEHHALVWKNVSFEVSKKGVKKTILSNLSGYVSSGEMIAIMGPSGAGKSTFLDLIAQRTQPSSGAIELDSTAKFRMRDYSSYVEQDDALLGVLTVRETVEFAATLSMPASTPPEVVRQRVDSTLTMLGISHVADNIIGTAIQRGVSGGQKRRVTIACAVVARPDFLILDEPTSGLDSATSTEVVRAVQRLTQTTNSVTLCTIHQPSYETISHFDKALLLANGRTLFFGSVTAMEEHFSVLGYPTPTHFNPTDHAMTLINTDFTSLSTLDSDLRETKENVIARYDTFVNAWQICERSDPSIVSPLCGVPNTLSPPKEGGKINSVPQDMYRTWVLAQRTFLNYRRNILNHGIRLAMYIGMSLMLAVIWIRLPKDDQRINDRLSVHFYGVAFLSFMSVAGIPSFLEERSLFIRERDNGLVGPGAFIISNTLVTLPFMFICAISFSLICYWAIGLHPGATAFWRFTFFLFLATIAAESQSVLVAAILPIFVASLAVASFMNGFWMSVGGYFMQTRNLPAFWRDWAHWIDYQTFAFANLVKNDFTGLVFTCQTLADGSCQCSYASSLIAQGQCAVSGQDVLDQLEIAGIDIGLYTGILICIIAVYRVMLYLALVLRRK